MLGHHKAVAHLGGLLLGLLDDADELVGQAHLLTLARNLGRAVDGILIDSHGITSLGAAALRGGFTLFEKYCCQLCAILYTNLSLYI